MKRAFVFLFGWLKWPVLCVAGLFAVGFICGAIFGERYIRGGRAKA